MGTQIAKIEGVSLNGPLDGDQILDLWPKVEPFICAALERDGWKMGPEDFIDDLAAGVMGLYVVRDEETGEILAALSAEVQDHPRASVFNIAYCGGKSLYRWANLIGGMEAEAARLGCDTVRITGRAGWGKVFPEYHEQHRVFERKVMVAK